MSIAMGIQPKHSNRISTRKGNCYPKIKASSSWTKRIDKKGTQNTYSSFIVYWKKRKEGRGIQEVINDEKNLLHKKNKVNFIPTCSTVYTCDDTQAVSRKEPLSSSTGIPTVSINLLSSNFMSICKNKDETHVQQVTQALNQRTHLHETNKDF